jgi:hypothetical protein
MVVHLPSRDTGSQFDEVPADLFTPEKWETVKPLIEDLNKTFLGAVPLCVWHAASAAGSGTEHCAAGRRWCWDPILNSQR